jgi:hypothetical protein
MQVTLIAPNSRKCPQLLRISLNRSFSGSQRMGVSGSVAVLHL